MGWSQILQQTAFAAGPQTWDWEMPAYLPAGMYALSLVTDRGVFTQVLELQ
ncbi:MAG TPA: hypothetical protein PK858_11285 [Saprospiraceae bacterium]|nr:hypothetical protein [Saprospiraceae bacterium]